MKALAVFLSIAILGLCLADCNTSNKAKTPGTTTSPDPLAADRAKYLDKARAYIAGKENMAADSVFQNIKIFKQIPANRLFVIMNIWSQVLGVSCDHCHVPGEWASEVKPEKEVTRQMVGLVRQLNDDLGKIEALKSERPSVSCYTCHRGDTQPATQPKGGFAK